MYATGYDTYPKKKDSETRARLAEETQRVNKRLSNAVAQEIGRRFDAENAERVSKIKGFIGRDMAAADMWRRFTDD